MRGRRGFWGSILAWVGVWAFWLATTRRSHPSFGLALIVTTSLIVSYAAAAYLNHLVLIPRLWRAGRRSGYAAYLAAVMLTFTAAALAVIRLAYRGLWGPDGDPNGVYKHFAIDLLGMAVHLVGALAVVVAARYARDRARPGAAEESARGQVVR